MPTLFSRSRTNSSPNKKPSLTNDDYKLTSDEFGRVSSRVSTRGIGNLPVGKKDKKRDKDDRIRPRTTSSTRERSDHGSYLADSIPDGAFLPLCLERPYDELGLQRPIEQGYGYLSYERHIVLGLEQLTRLVDVVTAELGTRGGLTTPFIFSSLALDISAPAIKRLIQTFLATCSKPGAADVERRWRDEAKFAGPYELGMCLRWGLARVVRSVGGQDVRGLISWDHYVQFRDSEAAQQYPPSHFSTFLPGLAQPLQSIILSVFSLLIRMTAHSASSGHTPPTLSPLFGPLLFGLGSPTLAFHHTYIHYLWATNATEHLILAFIRWQDAPRVVLSSTDINTTGVAHGSATSLGVPTRLKDWIRGYPAMLPFLKETNKHHKPQARKGARTVRVVSVRRNVRMYSSDLVKTAASWGQRPRPGFTSNERGLAASKEWERIAPGALKLTPRYSDAYKKRMDMPPHFHPDLGPGVFAMDTASSSTSSRTSSTTLEDEDPFGLGIGLLGVRHGEDRFRSLTDLKWGEFETMGFAGLGTDEKKLQFDLTEGARNARAAKRATLSWNDFSNSGFSRNDVPLNATLQFSTPISTTISSWPSHNAEISKKMKKAQRALPPFGWDTEPIIGTEEMVEEAFVDVFCDLIYGGGWMDLERVEEHDRECNWALVEFKALGSQRNSAIAGPDPRISSSLLLFEEFVPLEYRQQLAEGVTNRRRLPSLFSPSSKSKQWKPALTLNGRPYVVGHVPHIPSYREVEFEGLLRGTGDTKVISLGSRASVRPMAPTIPSVIAITDDRDSTPRPPDKTSSHGDGTATNNNNNKGSSGEPQPEPTMSTSAKRLSRFKLPGGIPVPSPGGGRKTGMVPAEYSTVEFETRVASYSDDEYQPDNLGQRQATEAEKRARRESKDDSWMEILVATQDRRMGSQEAEFRRNGKGGGGGGGQRSDPESASLEVAKALAAVLDRKPLSEDEADLGHETVDEVQLIPRRMAVYDGDYFSDLPHQEPVYEQESEPEPEPLQEDELEHEEPEEEEEEDEEEEEGEEEEGEEATTTPSGVSYLQQQKANRRLGYFDLHPERRQASAQDTDPAHLSQYGDEGDDTNVYPTLVDEYVAPLVPRKAVNPTALTDYELSATYLAMNDDSELDHTDDQRSSPQNGRTPVVDSFSRTPTKSNGNEIGSSIDRGTSKLSTPSKTAALIELYRERERGTPTKTLPAASQPSRLPVRALPTPPKEPVIVPSKTSPASAQPTLLPSTPPEPQLMDLPQVPVDETGRSSPARYVHGAPLHNVLEEEEEEP